MAPLFARVSLRGLETGSWLPPPVTLAAPVNAATPEPGAPEQAGSRYCCCDSTPCVQKRPTGADQRPVTGQSQRLRDDGAG